MIYALAFFSGMALGSWRRARVRATQAERILTEGWKQAERHYLGSDGGWGRA